MADPSARALHDAAIFCLGMAAAVHESADGPKIPKTFPLDLDAIKDLESVYWDHRDAPLSPVSRRLSALHQAPVQYGPFVRPNTHLICFDFARSVLDAVWSAADPKGFEWAGATGFDGSERIDFERFAERWPAVAKALRSLRLPDHRVIASAVQQEAARIADVSAPASTAGQAKSCFDTLTDAVLYWRNGVLPFYWRGAYHPGDFQRRTADPLRQCLVWLDTRGFNHLSARLQSGFDKAARCVSELDAKYDEHPAPADATESDAIVGDRLLPCYDETMAFVELVEDIKKATAGNESLIERLLTGPDDVELSPRDMALLEAHLRQPVSFATIQQEKKSTGHSPTEAARNKLKLIRDFNRGFQGQGDADEAENRDAPAPAVVQAEGRRGAAPGNDPALALMRVFTNGIADDRIGKATRLLGDNTLTVNEKLTKIDALIPFPATASAEQLGEMLGVTKQAVLKTEWWIQNRKGEKENEVGRRREGHRKRAKNYESPGQDDDE